jgi:hypothetical protein
MESPELIRSIVLEVQCLPQNGDGLEPRTGLQWRHLDLTLWSSHYCSYYSQQYDLQYTETADK